jgi:ribosome-binding ATPase YchF (GTP1/OBG family)
MDSSEFRAGRAEGVRAALAVVEALMAAEEQKLELPATYATRTARRTRWQAYRNVSSRLRTVLSRKTKGVPVSAEIEAKLTKMDSEETETHLSQLARWRG